MDIPTVLLVTFALQQSVADGGPGVSTQQLVHQMTDLARLSETARPRYRTVQFSSYDRRSTSRDAPHWFANSDGFGREKIPGFLATLREPDASGVGLYLLADVDGPGAIVRGWTAGMGGKLRVYLDKGKQPIFEGKAETFLRRRTQWFLDKLGIDRDTGNRFMQEDADYLPLPFARGLRVTWEGKVRDLHFYELQVRKYAKDARVRTFAVEDVAHLEEDPIPIVSISESIDARIPAGESHTHRVTHPGQGRILGLMLRASAADRRRALRGTRLRIFFDDASIAQVDAPLGDFFGSGPGVHPFDSTPFSVAADGMMTCRFPMPFAKSCAIVLTNTTERIVRITGSLELDGRPFGDDSLYFHAKWRADHDLIADSRAVLDLPYIVAIGSGRLVGVACMLMNPSGIPTPGGNWWGEGDEKIFVDGEGHPSVFGTGSEDFFNYSWSRPDLFAHPYCGQPLTSGPGTSGYVSNHRFLILDDVPFAKSLAFYMELKHHRRTPGFSYARIAYYYARPGAIDDHRALMPSDLVVPPLPARRPVADGGARRATFHVFRDMRFTFEGRGRWTRARAELAPSKHIRALHAKGGEKIRTTIDLPRHTTYRFRLVAAHRPDGGELRVFVGDEPLRKAGTDQTTVSLRTKHTERFLNVHFEPVECRAGRNRVVLEATTPGYYGFDYFWIVADREPPMRVRGALEAESLTIVGKSPGLEIERQGMNGKRWSNGRHLWVRGKRKGDFVELAVPARPGKHRLHLRLTKSWDYGVLQLHVRGKPIGPPVDTFNSERRAVGLLPEVDLGVHDLSDGTRLRFTVVGSNPGSEDPHFYFGIDCLRVTAAR